ncbi:hypothetical protein JCM9279_002806 [Rhodotorula babjevae]
MAATHKAPPAPSNDSPAASSGAAPGPAARTPPRIVVDDPSSDLSDEDEPAKGKLKIDKTPLSEQEQAAGKLLYSHLVLRRDQAALEPLVRRPALRKLVESVDFTALVADDAREKKRQQEQERKEKLREEKERREKEERGMMVEGEGGGGSVGRASAEKKAAEEEEKAGARAAAKAQAAEDKAAEDQLVAEHMATILADLPDVKVVRAVSCDELVRVFLSQAPVRLEKLEIQLLDPAAGDLFRGDGAAAVSKLSQLRCDEIEDDADLPALRHLTTLHVSSYCDAATFLALVDPIRGQLVDLAFPVSSRIRPFDLGSFVMLQRFRLRIQHEPFAAGDVSGIERVVVVGFKHFLDYVGRQLPHVQHLYLEGTLKVRTWDDRTSSNPVHLPPRTADILLSVPRHIPHLTLDTNCIRPADAAAFFLDPALRPRGLETLALGGETGRGLCALLRGSENPYTALGKVLKDAEIEVTTVR